MPRPKPKLTPEQIESLQAMSAYRLPMHMIATILGVSKSTLERLARDNKEVQTAIDLGRANGAVRVIQTAYQMACSGHWPSMTQFWLKTQEGFRETDRLELTGPNGQPLSVIEATPEMRKERLSQLLELRGRLEREVVAVADEDDAEGVSDESAEV